MPKTRPFLLLPVSLAGCATFADHGRIPVAHHSDTPVQKNDPTSLVDHHPLPRKAAAEIVEHVVAEAPTSGGFANVDVVGGPIASTLWRMTIPLAFGFIINAVYSWTNMFFVSRLGADAIAALGIGDQVNFVIFTLASGFCIGTGIIVARRVGEDRRRQASVIVTQAYNFIALYSTGIAVAVWLLVPFLLDILGMEPRVRSYAETYIRTLLFGFPAGLLVFQVNASVRSTGNTVFPMVVLMITAVLNAVLDPILIFGLLGMPALGVKGASIATVTSQCIGATVSTIVLARGSLGLRLYRPTWRFDRHIIGSIFRLGVPASMQGLSVAVGRVVLIGLATQFGTAAAAAYTIGLRVDVLVYMPIFATGIAIETLVSQNIGAGRFDRVKSFRNTALRHLSSIIAAMGVGIFLAAHQVATIFSDDPRVVSITVDYLHVAVFGYLFFVIGQTATRSLSGAGHAMRSMMIVAGILFAVQLPLAWFLSHGTHFGVVGIFIGIAASYLAFAIIGTHSVRGESWMYKTV